MYIAKNLKIDKMVLGSELNITIFFMVAIIIVFVYYAQKRNKNDKKVIDASASASAAADTECSSVEGFNDDSSDDEFFDEKNETNSNKKHSNKKYSGKKHSNSEINRYYYTDKGKYLDNIMNILDKSHRNDPGTLSCPKKNRRIVHDNKSIPVNMEFIEMQYHKDYNDTITAINNLTPQKELFNLGYLPVRQIDPDPKNVDSLVNLFMDKLNGEIVNNVQEYLNVNSAWSDMGKRRREKSGFEQQMEELGLPGSLYNEPAVKAPVVLVKIDKAEQSNTNDQIRFTAYVVIQKVNVRDQMAIQINFFMEREDLKTDRDDRANFFTKGLPGEDDDEKVDPDQIVVIEQVFILGYLTRESEKRTKMDKFHDYKKNIYRTDGTINQEEVIKAMLTKHKERQNELDSFMCTLDDDTKEIHGVPDVDNYTQYKNTRTIMDDLAKFPQRSFGDITI
jgi:hypothetical protein